MGKSLLIRIFICIFIFSLFLYLHIEKQNELTQVGIRLPELSKELQTIQDENARLRFEVNRFENPTNLIELVKKHEFSHLKHPLVKHIQMIPEALASRCPREKEKSVASYYKTKPTSVVGAR